MLERKGGFETSVDNYLKSAQTLADIAQNVVGKSVPKETVQHWKLMMYAIRIGDDRVDRIHNVQERDHFKRDAMKFLRNEPVSFGHDSVLEGAMLGLLKGVCGSLPESRQTLLLITFDRLLRVTELLRQSSSIQELSSYTRFEGQITSNLFLATLPDEYADSKKRTKLHQVFTRVGRFANSLDSFIDFPDDHREGLTMIKPSIINRVKLLITSIPDAVSALQNLRPNFELLRQIGRRTFETVENNPHR